MLSATTAGVFWFTSVWKDCIQQLADQRGLGSNPFFIGMMQAPDGVNQFVDYVAPGSMYAVVNGQGYSLDWRWENGRVISKKMTAPTQDKIPAALVGAKA